MSNYYQQQIEKLGNIRTGAPVLVKFTHHDYGNTNWLSLNDESATEIVQMLSDNFNVNVSKGLNIDLTKKEIDDIVRGLIIAMQQLDSMNNLADTMLSHRLEIITEMLRDNINL